MYDLNGTLNECEKELDKLGIKYGGKIEIKANSKSRSLGLTTMHKDGSYTIEVASMFLNEQNPRSALKETVMHELLHTCKNSLCHTGNWKVYANRVNKVYGYHISRTVTLKSLGIVEDNRPIKHKLVCKNCGAIFARQRECNLTRHPEYYFCSCGGKIEKIY